MSYPSIRIEGAIFSPDILDRLEESPGQRPADFNLDTGTKVKDEIARAWADAQDYWRIFQRKLDNLKPDSPATTETRQQWIVPLLGLLGYQLEYQAKGVELNGKNYTISHRAINRGQTPVHVVGYREAAGLDRKPERTHIGAPRMSAHALVQEYLNLHDELYGIVTNGRILRLLRDSSRLIKLSYLEFDLDRIFSDGLFADFAILYRLLHFSRLPQTIDQSTASWLERYHQDSIEQGSRIREGLRIAVTEALEILGTGFLIHPDNHTLREQAKCGQLKADVYFNYLLRIVYRLLFLMVIEERGLVFPKGTHSRFISIYSQHYSVQRLRRLAVTRGLRVDRFHDAWDALQATFQIFERPDKAAIIGTTALGGQLFHPQSLGLLHASVLSNAALFHALDKLCNFDDLKTGNRAPVNFGALATEEFGSVYESLLELHPLLESTPTPHFRFKQAAGNERKTTGSYYTPASLVDCLIDSALDPVLNNRLHNFAALGYPSADAAVLDLKVCDPACGSGHFLIAAAQRIARRLATLRAGDEEPGPDLLRHTLREVIGHCIFGVDINPMSVELCKLGLWLEAMEPGRPLTFLDHHIKCGNSLLGSTPQAIKDGIPDDAYKPIAGDTKVAATWMKKLNQTARAGQGSFDFNNSEPGIHFRNLPAALTHLENLSDDSAEAVAEKERVYREIVEGRGYDSARLLHDAWCAAFVWPKNSIDISEALTTDHLRAIERNPHSVAPRINETVRQLAAQYRFFHWYLEFPVVFGSEGVGGFDCVVGNPPWDMVEFSEKEYFAERAPAIAEATSARKRQAKIETLEFENPALWNEYLDAKRITQGRRHFIQNSGHFPLGSNGRINLYPLFTELSVQLINPAGRSGLIVPSSISMDAYNAPLFKSILERRMLISLFDFENSGDLFPSVHRSYRFCMLTLGKWMGRIQLFYFAHTVDELAERSRRIELAPDDLATFSPNTLAPPILKNERDSKIALSVYRRHGVFFDRRPNAKNKWLAVIQRMLSLSDDGDFFRRADEISVAEQNDGNTWKSLYSGKVIHGFNHRFATFDNSWLETSLTELSDPSFSPKTEYYARTEEVLRRTEGKYPSNWLVGFRDIARATDERTAIAAVIPPTACDTHCRNIYFPVIRSTLVSCLVANLNSFCFDYFAKQKVIGTGIGATILEQLPVLPPDSYSQKCQWSTLNLSVEHWLLPRILELTYTAWDLAGFAHDCNFDGPPFRWDDSRRFQLRCELDAAFFHIYGIPRDDVEYIMNTFPIVKRKDEAQYGTYRTRDSILILYDALAEAQRSGKPFVSPLDPPPADLRRCHPPLMVERN
jgi:hypothetical protein